MGTENCKALCRVSNVPGNERLLRKDWNMGKKGKMEINVTKGG